MTDTELNPGRGLFDLGQPPLPADRLAAAARNLLVYRVMAFVTGVVLLSGTIALILKYAAGIKFGALYAVLWVGHGWLYIIYVIVTFLLGLKLRWPIPRHLLVMLAGTIPTASFVAEHFVTKAAREAARP